MKLVNIDQLTNKMIISSEQLSMKCLGKMWLMIILSHKKAALHALSRRWIFGKTPVVIPHHSL